MSVSIEFTPTLMYFHRLREGKQLTQSHTARSGGTGMGISSSAQETLNPGSCWPP